jgi:NAD(P)-dependent dehydrogenase (short-subunit alcohol dehydrogenase family)
MSSSKTVFITGASIGIGRATAELFQSKGWNVVATMRNPEAGAAVSGNSNPALAELENVLVTKLDVNDQASIDSAIAAAIARFGSIDVLVNNAGFGIYGILEATSLDQLRQQFETNVIGLLATTKAVIPGFRKQHSGVIVNIGSIAGRISLPAGTPYNGSKFAVEGITEALSYEMRAIGVRVKLVEPGFIKPTSATPCNSPTTPPSPNTNPSSTTYSNSSKNSASTAQNPPSPPKSSTPPPPMAPTNSATSSAKTQTASSASATPSTTQPSSPKPANSSGSKSMTRNS